MFRKSEDSAQLDIFKNLFSQVGSKKRKKLESLDSWHNKFHEKVTLDEGIFRVLYSDSVGRPNQSIRLLSSMIIIKEGLNLTDEQLYNRGSYDLQVMLALGMTNIDDTLPSPSTYYLFKQMVEEYNESKRKDLFGDLFRSLASSIAKCFDISGKQTRMDSKLFSSNIAKSTRLQLVIKSIGRNQIAIK